MISKIVAISKEFSGKIHLYKFFSNPEFSEQNKNKLSNSPEEVKGLNNNNTFMTNQSKVTSDLDESKPMDISAKYKYKQQLTNYRLFTPKNERDNLKFKYNKLMSKIEHEIIRNRKKIGYIRKSKLARNIKSLANL